MRNRRFSLYTKGNLLAALVFLVGSILTFLVCLSEHEARENSKRALLQAVSDRFEESVDRTLGEAEAFERSLVAFFLASEQIDPTEWECFVELAANNLLVPGVKGLAVVVIERDQLFLRHGSLHGRGNIEKLGQTLSAFSSGSPTPARYSTMDDPSEPGGKLLTVSVPFADSSADLNLVLLQLDLEIFVSGLWNRQGDKASECSLKIRSAKGDIYSNFTDKNDYWTSLTTKSLHGGEPWVVEMAAPKRFFDQLGESHLSSQCLVGFLLSFLSAALTRSLVLQNVEARGRAKALSSGVAARSRVLEQTNKELRFFFDVVSRELRSPLSELRSMAHLVEKSAGGVLEGASREHLRKMSIKVDVMDELLSDLLAYTSIDTSGAALEHTKPDLLLADLHQLVAWPSDAQFVIDSEVEGLDTLVSPLRQVLLNLIANAVRYRSERPLLIRATVKRSGDYAVFSIADNGIGIDPAHQQSVFRMFHRLKQTQDEGTGVGLAIVDKVVSSAGGTVSLESTPGVGSVFSFTWPLEMSEL